MRILHTFAAIQSQVEDQHLSKFTENISKVVRKVYSQKGSSVNLVSTNGLENIMDKVVKEINSFENVLITLECLPNFPLKLPRRKLNIFLVDSLETFEKIMANTSTKSHDFHGYFTIIWMNTKRYHTREILEMMWKRQIYKVVVVSLENSLIKAHNFNPFSNKSCSDTKPHEVLNVSNYFDHTLKDMNQCPVNVHAPVWAPFIFIDDNGNPTGRDFEFVKIIEKYLNFTMNLTILQEPAGWGMLYSNGTATGAMEKLLKGETDIIFGDFYLRQSRIKYMDPSEEYFKAEIVFVVPPGRSLESIEKLLQPFSRPVWICFSFSIIFGLVIIAIINFWTKRIYEARILNLILKATSIIFGVSTAHPKRTFHRMIFISITIGCLVLESAYNGSLFRFLQKDSNLNEVQSIDEMITNDFMFYNYDSMLEVIEQNNKINERYLN